MCIGFWKKIDSKDESFVPRIADRGDSLTVKFKDAGRGVLMLERW